MLFIELVGSPIVESECLFVDHLTIVDKALDRGASREMSHIDLKSFVIIKIWILSNQESLSKLAE